jgi:hypothetical protein
MDCFFEAVFFSFVHKGNKTLQREKTESAFTAFLRALEDGKSVSLWV